MREFFREYWFYIVAPVVIVVAAVVAMMWFASGEDTPFVYNIF